MLIRSMYLNLNPRETFKTRRLVPGLVVTAFHKKEAHQE